MRKVLGILSFLTASFAVVPSASCDERPNFLLIVFEDMSPHLGSYGDQLADTPVLDTFAKEAGSYDAAFTAAGVCAPSRAALITGMHQQSWGAQNMRTSAGFKRDGKNFPYQAVPPAYVKALPEILRAAGYYTTNNGKTDYQMGGHDGGPFTIWDEQATDQPWAGRSDNQPFFAMVNIMETHESYLFDFDAITSNDHPYADFMRRTIAPWIAAHPQRTDPAEVHVPQYLPDTPRIRRDIARQYDNLHYAEQTVAHLLQRLDQEGLAQNTIVIITSDHGDGLPRAKRTVYDSGLRVPLMIRHPSGEGAGTRNGELVSFVDLAPTILSLAHLPVPSWMQGRAFLGDAANTAERGYIHAAMDRHDEAPDHARAVRDARWKYIRNSDTGHPLFQHLAFRDLQLSMRSLWHVADAGKLGDVPRTYFVSPRPAEELYDTWSDPEEVRNLASDEDHTPILEKMRDAMDRFQARTPDLSDIDEAELVEMMWPGFVQPVTSNPVILHRDGEISMSAPTQGASIGYRLDGGAWRLYTRPFVVGNGQSVEARAVRYGFAESQIVRLDAQETKQ